MGRLCTWGHAFGCVIPFEHKLWSKAMQSTHPATIPANQVMALFADRALSFSLSKDATFAELADCLDRLGEWHTGMPMAVYLKFGAARQPVRVLPPGI
jgi:hypothetical protein